MTDSQAQSQSSPTDSEPGDSPAAVVAPEHDLWHNLVHEEIPAHQARLMKLASAEEGTIKTLLTEVSGTALAFVRDVGKMALQISASSSSWLDGLSNHVERLGTHVESIDARVELLESLLGGGTQIATAHSEMLVAFIDGSMGLFEEWKTSLADKLDAEGRQKLEDHIALGGQCLNLVRSSTVEDDDDDDDEADEPDEADDELASLAMAADPPPPN